MTKKLEQRVAALENATGGSIDIAADLTERLRRWRQNPEAFDREVEERLARMEQDFHAGALEGIELRLHLARMKGREEKLEQ